jgi:hypothetical protein
LAQWLPLAFLIVSLCPVKVSACDGQTGRGPFTIAGRIQDSQGNPVPDIRLGWLPALPETLQPDIENIYYTIQGRDIPEGTSAQDGAYAIKDVLDYFDVASKQYVVWDLDLAEGNPRHPYLRLVYNTVNLNRTPPGTVNVDFFAVPAGALLVRAATKDGKPYEGSLPLYFECPGDEEDPPIQLALNCKFVNGEYLQGGLKPSQTKVAILKGATAEEVKFKNYISSYSSGHDAPVVQVTAQDFALEMTVPVEAQATTTVQLSVPAR